MAIIKRSATTVSLRDQWGNKRLVRPQPPIVNGPRIHTCPGCMAKKMLTAAQKADGNVCELCMLDARINELNGDS